MTVSEILELIKAGYSKDEIEAMGDPGSPKPEAKPEAKKNDEKIPDPEPETKPEAKPEAKPDEKDKVIEALKAQVKELQDAAAAGAKQEKKTEKVTAESVIRDFIGKL